MSNEMVKINCSLEGDAANDFERLMIMLKINSIAPNHRRQQSLLIGSALLVMDALLRKYTEEVGERYPEFRKFLEFAGCRPVDIEKLVSEREVLPVDAIKSAIAGQAGEDGKK